MSILFKVFCIIFACTQSFCYALNVGDKALDEQNIIELQANKGHVLYLDFWASWCAPCQDSLSWMNTLSETFKNKPFKVIAVNIDKRKEKADELLSLVNPSYTIRYDPAGLLASNYDLESMPMSYIIDKEGIIRAVFKGFSSTDSKEIEKIIAEYLEK